MRISAYKTQWKKSIYEIHIDNWDSIQILKIIIYSFEIFYTTLKTMFKKNFNAKNHKIFWYFNRTNRKKFEFIKNI